MLTMEDKWGIEEYLRREAHLLDEHRLREWVDLFTDDSEYFIPLSEHVQGNVGPAGHPVVKDDKKFMLARVLKHETGFSHSETPVSATCRLISNIVVDESEHRSDEVIVRSTFIVRQARGTHDNVWWSGRRRDILRRSDSSWQIARREINLDCPVLPQGISIFF